MKKLLGQLLGLFSLEWHRCFEGEVGRPRYLFVSLATTREEVFPVSRPPWLPKANFWGCWRLSKPRIFKNRIERACKMYVRFLSTWSSAFEPSSMPHPIFESCQSVIQGAEKTNHWEQIHVLASSSLNTNIDWRHYVFVDPWVVRCVHFELF